MIKVSNEELSKIAQFVSSCDDMANGKFILADVKINRILNMIAGSDELYRYISECLVGYDFSREYHRAEVKNGLNGGIFAVPAEPNKLVAFVFCLLVECDAKRLDFYNFVNENFAGDTRSEAYNTFSKKLIKPFKEIVAGHFGLAEGDESEVSLLKEEYARDLQQNPVFSEENNYNFDSKYQNNDKISNGDDVNMQNNEWNKNDYETEYDAHNMHRGDASANAIQSEQVADLKQPEEPLKKPDIWNEICEICDNVEDTVDSERHLKPYLKEELLYVLSTIKYSVKYKDVKIISALVTAFDEMSKKFRSIQFVFSELKNKLELLYK